MSLLIAPALQIHHNLIKESKSHLKKAIEAVNMSANLTLLTEYKISADLVLKNRVLISPLTRARCGCSQVPNQAVVDYYTQRASAGLIISEGTIVSKQGMGWAGAAAIYEPQHVEGWKKVTKAVHGAGGVIFCQLWHMGRQASECFHGLQPISVSGIKSAGQATDYDLSKVPHSEPSVIKTDEVADVVEEFRHAAANAKEVGFDGVELHGANGFIIDEFLQSATNKRTDRYGGSLENRFRFVAEVLDAILTVFPSSRVAVRLGPNGNFAGMGGVDNFEAYTYFFSRLNAYNLAFVDVLDGLDFGFHGLCKQVKLADVRKVFDNAIVGNVGYNKLTAEGAINTGAADLVAFGRAWLANPDLVERFRNDWPLADADYSIWWSYPNFPDGDHTVGFTDFPAYSVPTDEK